MAWPMPWGRKTAMPSTPAIPPAVMADATDEPWERHVAALADAGIPEPGSRLDASRRRPATGADHEALYGVAPSFADMLPWVEYLPGSRSMLLEDGQSVSAFFELAPVGTEGREMTWLCQAWLRSSRRRILPTLLLGNSSRNSIYFGRL